MTVSTKVDRKRDHPELYRPPRKPVLVDVPEMSFFMVDGQGDPNGPEFQNAVEALYTASYTAKFLLKRVIGTDFKVMPLEGLWWSDDMESFARGDTEQWQWTAMIAQPDSLTEELFTSVINEARKKRELPGLARLRLEQFTEGQSAQVMHVGPYSAERPTIEALEAFISDHELVRSGKHHEIYLGDPRRSAPEKLKTIIRYAVAPK